MEEETADEMFERLGYTKYVNDKYSIEYMKDESEITFLLREKIVSCKDYYRDMGCLTMEEIQAINKKLKELRWIDVGKYLIDRGNTYRGISLEEMFDTLVKSIINKKEAPTFYYGRENFNGAGLELAPITEVDLLDNRFKLYDGDFSCYDWELNKVNIFVLEESNE